VGSLPARLLDLSPVQASNTIRVISSDELEPDTRYGTVSHCWGQAKTIKLLSDNLSRFSQGIEYCELSPKYQEAIQMALAVGLRFLWIDSLCIVQNSTEDWAREAIRMADIYGRSYLNIALAGASGDHDRALARRKEEPIRIPFLDVQCAESNAHQRYWLLNEATLVSDVNGSKLFSRAWVMQEIFLAPRTLILGSTQVWFQCREGKACETFPGWFPPYWYSMSFGGGVSVRYDGIDHKKWYEICQHYSTTDITFQSDRVIAISGIARNFEVRLKEEYLAGHWKSQFPYDLAWKPKGSGAFRPEQEGRGRAPSLSWLSVECHVDWSFLRRGGVFKAPCKLIDVSPSPPGQVFSSRNPKMCDSLTLLARLVPFVLQTNTRIGLRKDALGENLLRGWTASGSVFEFPSRIVNGPLVGASWQCDEVGEEDGKELVGPSNPDAYCLHLFTWEIREVPRGIGLVVNEVEDQQGVFVRCGTFGADRKEPCAPLPEGGVQSMVRLV
jgi:hypothetical protein